MILNLRNRVTVVLQHGMEVTISTGSFASYDEQTGLSSQPDKAACHGCHPSSSARLILEELTVPENRMAE